mgnify:CR=1 FL=1
MRFRFFGKEIEIRKHKIIRFIDQQKVIFIHPPKSGGTSITTALRKKYVSEFILNNEASLVCSSNGEIDWDKTNSVRNMLLEYNATIGKGFISGHFSGINPIHFQLKGYKVMTVLRDPVDAFISKYFFTGQEQELSDFLNSEKAIAWGTDLVNRFGNIEGGSNEEKLEKAKAELSKFDYVGKIEDINGLQEWLKSVGKNIRVNRLNVSKNRRVLDAEFVDQIESLCYFDILLYKSISFYSECER